MICTCGFKFTSKFRTAKGYDLICVDLELEPHLPGFLKVLTAFVNGENPFFTENITKFGKVFLFDNRHDFL